MAAVLACGEGAVIGRRSAASMWRMLPAVGEEEPVEVLGAHRAMSRPGIRVRRTGPLERDEVTVRDNIPITTPERTLYDLAGLVSERELERSVGETFALRLAQRPRILALLDRYAGRRGATRLRRLLQEESSIALCRSEAEERFLELIRKAALAGVQANVTVAGHRVDFVWRTERLVVEIDGRAFHSTKRKFEGDRRRDADLVAAGLRVIRVTWRQIMNEPEVLIARLAQALVRPMQL
jgi:very-short-patch-repair endonuclease